MVVAVVGLVVLGSAAFVTLVSDHSVDRVVSGRWTLVKDTWAVYENHPVVGVGIASQPAASRDETSGPRSKRLTLAADHSGALAGEHIQPLIAPPVPVIGTTLAITWTECHRGGLGAGVGQ